MAHVPSLQAREDSRAKIQEVLQTATRNAKDLELKQVQSEGNFAETCGCGNAAQGTSCDRAMGVSNCSRCLEICLISLPIVLMGIRWYRGLSGQKNSLQATSDHANRAM